MPSSAAMKLAQHDFIALAERALLWPAQRALIISDLHLGKGDVFRAAGIAVPTGGTHADLDRLTTMISAYGAMHLIIVGDILHASSKHPKWLPAWQAFCAKHREVGLHVVVGNHDKHLDPVTLGVDAHDTLHIDGITFAHEKLGSVPQINGHLHPVVKVPGIGGRWPVFWKHQNGITLPAFSLFTGGHLVDARGHWIACMNGEVLAHEPVLPASKNLMSAKRNSYAAPRKI